MGPVLSAAMFYTMCAAFSRCCPPSHIVNPCTCSGPSSFTVLRCDNLATVDNLRQVTRNLHYHTHDFGKFSMADSKITVLEPESFGPLRFEYIFIKKSTLTDIKDGALEPSRDTLKRIEVTHCELRYFPFRNVSTFPKLENIQLSYNHLKTIPDYAFKYNPNLKKIDLSFNKISYIGNYAFYYVPFLKELNLKNNRLKVINNNAFAVHVKPNDDFVLDLSNNQILMMAEGAFQNQFFKMLNMSNNRLKSLPENHFRPLMERMAVKLDGGVDVQGNRLNCSCGNVEWLMDMQPYYHRFIKGFECSETHKNLEHLSRWELGCEGSRNPKSILRDVTVT
ncbi:leucine-rich repeat-containing protein 57-like [Ornithodoros turicata]|uniref:leucine-rich repeat-containing protein 57-like n=1 Tax=Ornithodoros turicata TaxID=34597 RepID=UPI00313A3152